MTVKANCNRDITLNWGPHYISREHQMTQHDVLLDKGIFLNGV